MIIARQGSFRITERICIMKELIYRNIYLMRKNLIIYIGMASLMYFIGLFIAVSAKCGNIARYASNAFIKDCQIAAMVCSILAGVLLGVMVEYVSISVDKDYRKGWHNYVVSSGVKREKYIASDYILLVIQEVISIAAGLLGLLIMGKVTGLDRFEIIKNGGDRQQIVFLIMSLSFLFIMGAYMTLISYLAKGKDTMKVRIIKTVPIFLLSVSAVIGCVFAMTGKMDVDKLVDFMASMSKHPGPAAFAVFLLSLAVTFVCCLMSVRSVKKEGKAI